MSSVLQEAVDGFLRYLKVERQLSPLTLSSYARQLEALVSIADEMKVGAWSQLDPAMVRSMAARSRRAGLAASSLALRLSALRSFLDWQVSQDMLPANPAKGIATPRNGRHLPKNIDVDEVNQLLEIDLNDPLAIRDRTMLEVMYGGGFACPNWSIWTAAMLILRREKSGYQEKAIKSGAYRLDAQRSTGLSNGCRTVSPLTPTTMRCFSPAGASASLPVMFKNVLPNGALNRA